MRGWNSIFIPLLLLAAQILVWNYFNLSQFVLLTFLPVMILCLPVKVKTIPALLIAFAVGMAVDFFSSGILGMTCAALLPVAFCRRTIITLVYGEEVFSRGENISSRRQGPFKMTLGITMATALFMLVYIWIDGAGIRPFWFNLVRFFCSLIASVAVSLFVAGLLTDEDSARWR